MAEPASASAGRCPVMAHGMQRPLPMDDAYFINPYPSYDRVRAQAAAVFDPVTESWLVTRHADVDRLLRDPRLSKDTRPDDPTPFEATLGPTMLLQDPPNHTRLRRLTNRLFIASALKPLEPGITKAVDALIDAMLRRSGGNFVADFAQPFPIAVIGELLDIPEADRPALLAAAEGAVTDDPDPAVRFAELDANMRFMREYFTPFCAERRRNPGTDLVSQLIAAGSPDDRLTEVEQVALCCMILLGGYVTSVCAMSLGVLLLLQNPEAHARLRQDPQLWNSAVEEILRLESPVQRAIYLVAVEDIPLDGVTIPAGGKVALMLGAANRDPAAFPEPDRFDITRLPNRHLAFATGPHHCLGATLARMEARIAFPRLVARLPNLRLAPPVPKAPAWRQVLPRWLRPDVPAAPAVVWLSHEHARGMRELHLAW